MRLDLSASNGEAKLQSHSESTLNCNAEIGFCYQNEPLFLIRAGAEEEGLPNYPSNMQFYLGSSWSEISC